MNSKLHNKVINNVDLNNLITETNSIPIGVDYGNEILKVKTTNHEIGIANLIAAGRNRRKLTADKAHPINLLDVDIVSKGKNLGRWFVGGMAFKYSHSRLLNREEGGNKADYPYLIHSILTAIAYCLYDPNNPQSSHNIILGTGLSAEEFWQREEHRTLLYNRIVGEHTIKFHNPIFNNAQTKIHIKDIVVMPESSAAALNYITTDTGKQNDFAYSEIKNSLNVIVDIGGFTTDVAVLYDGDFEDSFGFDSGVAEPMNLIAESLLKDYNIDVNRQQVGIAIRKSKGVIRTRQGDVVDINQIVDEYLQEFTINITSKLYKTLRINDIKKNQINKVYFVGGGALSLQKYLIQNITDLDFQVLNEPLMANVRGYYIAARDKGIQIEKPAVYDEDDIYM